MGEYLLFRLYGPMAAWGETAVGESRHSAAYPSKSAVTGLLAAALGITRDRDDLHRALNNETGFGVKVQTAGIGITDYHTAQVPPASAKTEYRSRKQELAAPKLNTILSSRDYRCDALAVAAVWLRTASPTYSLEEMAAALRKPKFTLYLGRKSCPMALPLEPQILSVETLRDALDQARFLPFGEELLTRDAEAFYAWEETDRAGMNSHRSVPRYDLALSRRRWQFSSRPEYHHFGEGEC